MWVLLLRLASFSLNVIVSLSYSLHQSTLDTVSIQSPVQKSIFGMFERAITFSTGIIAR